MSELVTDQQAQEILDWNSAVDHLLYTRRVLIEVLEREHRRCEKCYYQGQRDTPCETEALLAQLKEGK